jgi:hypothetical protein
MCFSAGASFGVGATLAVAGISAIAIAKTPREKVFAAIPLIFAIQQGCEGILWTAIPNPEYAGWVHPATMTFLVFALMVWPVWIPLSVWLLEDVKSKKQIIGYTLILGLLVALYHAYNIFGFPAAAAITGYHIQYTTKYPFNIGQIVDGCYGIATILPTFLSSNTRMRILGITIIISYIIAQIFFDQYVISVWCFFAAIISGVIFFILNGMQRGEAASPVSL